METIYRNIERIPISKHPSLKGFNAADEFLLELIPDLPDSVAIYNDNFGFLSTNLAHFQPKVVCDLKSQATAITKNCINNRGFGLTTPPFFIMDEVDFKASVALLKIPKSMGMFEQYLEYIHRHLEEDGLVLAGFMTRYFSAGFLDSARLYFDEISQSKAKKKARILILKKKKSLVPKKDWNTVNHEGIELKQYEGVFSSKKVDKATLFLLDYLDKLTPEKTDSVIDLGCGNGVIGKMIHEKTVVKDLHFVDDSQLAVSSAQNNNTENGEFHHEFSLDKFEDDSIDWVITNPPFHFEHSIDTSVAMGLFIQAHRVLRPNGVLTIVANANLGYESLLKRTFSRMEIQASTANFNIFQCYK